MRVCLYCRVSTDEQARHGFSLGAQIEALRKFATAHRYNVVGEFIDEGITIRSALKEDQLSRLEQLADAIAADIKA